MPPEALHVAVVLSPFILLPVAGWLGGRGARYASLLALVPAALTAYFGFTYWVVSTSGPFTVTLPWAPNLGLSLSFHLDGLGLLFATLITAIGVLIVLYAADYLGSTPGRTEVSRLAVRLHGLDAGCRPCDNVLALFVFWELTGFTSYLLIGFEHERPEARRAALQALLVTGAGRPRAAGGRQFCSRTLAARPACPCCASNGSSLTDDPAYAGIVVLVLLAAFTKSAQFPFHFWLPNAMQAPTPVSAYLHSATMVKAGVYLVARMTPLLGGTASVDGFAYAGRRADDAGRVVSRRAGNRSQAHPRLFDDQRAWRADAAARHGHAAGRHGGARLPGGTRVLQGCALSRRRRGRARDRHTRCPITRRTHAVDAEDRTRRDAGRRIDGAALCCSSGSSRRSSCTTASGRRLPFGIRPEF